MKGASVLVLFTSLCLWGKILKTCEKKGTQDSTTLPLTEQVPDVRKGRHNPKGMKEVD